MKTLSKWMNYTSRVRDTYDPRTFNWSGQKITLDQKEEERLDAFTAALSRLAYLLILITCLGFIGLVSFSFFAEYIGFQIKDPEVVKWCEEIHPTWTYEQCDSMVGR